MTPKLRGLGELAAYLPYLIGFVPRRSLVVVSYGAGVLGLVSRIDVPPEDQCGEAAQMLVTQLQRAGARRFDLIGYEDDGLDPRPLMRATRTALRDELGVEIGHEVVVRDGATYCIEHCGCPGCQTLTWKALPEANRVAAVADKVLGEVEPCADREALEDTLAPAYLLLQRAILAMAQQPVPSTSMDDADVVAAAWAAVLDVSDGAPQVHRLPPDTLVEVLLSLQDVQQRDELIAWLMPHALGMGELVPELRAALVDQLADPIWRRPDSGSAGFEHSVAVQRITYRLQQLVALTPDPFVDGAATLLALWCWSHGSGALASIAVDRALDSNPAYAMANLIGQALAQGLPPFSQRPIQREIAS